MTSNHAITLPLWPTIAGLVYLAVIGLGEEIVSRGFVFGVLRKHGRALALILSSVFFGAMHVNVYLGSDWSAYSAYWHSVSAAGFGFLMACIMIVTRSILMPIIAHALFDWTVVFSAPSKDHTQKIYHFDPLWQTIKDTGAELMINVSLGLGLLAILWICRVARVPKWFISIARKLKMIEPVLHS
jgi:membrane protease YdiL (CAAX protease family)